MTLPIRKVVLLKHGVGYFERQGKIDGDANVDLHFRTDEMNDVLKSLTTLDLGEGIISSISYESTKPIEKQLEDVAVRLPEKNALTGLLTQVKGARVAVESGKRTVEGTVVGTETVTRRDREEVITHEQLALLVDGSDLETFDLLEVKRVRFLDDSLKQDLQHLLDILITAKKKDLKRLTIFARGTGEREIVVSYVVETPVWKTSYRMLLGTEKPLVQGWALVDNIQDEDWNDVALSLVAGLPISFVHDLYSPRYKRRPVVRVKEEEAYAPPELEAGIPKMAEEPWEDDADEEMNGMLSSVVDAPMGGAMPMARAAAAPRRRGRSEARAASVKVQTRAVEVGDLFQYRIENPVTVKRGQSALVPILQEPFGGKRVAIYNPEVREKNPMSAILFENTTGMTLEGGPVTVLEEEEYVGEAMLETMKPDEERLVPFSVELGCVITLDHKSDNRQFHRAQIANGYLYLYRYRIERKLYRIHNKLDRELDLFLDHRFNSTWDLEDTAEPVETTESFYRFRMTVPPKKVHDFEVKERGDTHETHALQHVDSTQIQFWLEQRYIDRKTTAVLEELHAMNLRASELNIRIEALEAEVQEIFRNQERLRKNLQALGTTQDEKGLRERYVQELSTEEDKLKEHRSELRRLKKSKQEAEEDLRTRLAELRFDAKL